MPCADKHYFRSNSKRELLLEDNEHFNKASGGQCWQPQPWRHWGSCSIWESPCISLNATDFFILNGNFTFVKGFIIQKVRSFYVVSWLISHVYAVCCSPIMPGWHTCPAYYRTGLVQLTIDKTVPTKSDGESLALLSCFKKKILVLSSLVTASQRIWTASTGIFDWGLWPRAAITVQNPQQVIRPSCPQHRAWLFFYLAT